MCVNIINERHCYYGIGKNIPIYTYRCMNIKLAPAVKWLHQYIIVNISRNNN